MLHISYNTGNRALPDMSALALGRALCVHIRQCTLPCVTTYTCHTLGEPKARALPVFHALTGCGTTSVFRGKGKKFAWQAWQAFEEVTDIFKYLSLHPFEDISIGYSHFTAIERFVVVLYD